jgi:F-type H+-transporting ATPase subunit gamma
MERYARLRQRIGSVHDLLEVTAAMRSLAAVRVQQAQDALTAIRQYTAVISEAMGEALPLLAPGAEVLGAAGDEYDHRHRALLMFASEHGFVGAFNEALVDRASRELAEEHGEFFVVGGRGALVAEERGLSVNWAIAMATHPGQVIEVAQRVAMELYRRFAKGEIGRIDLVFPCYEAGGRSIIDSLTLLPLDLERFRGRIPTMPPLLNLSPAALVEELVEEYFFAELARAAMESFISENGARLQVMDSAHETVEGKLEELGKLANRIRQEEVTTELLDIVTGAEALRQGQPL